MADEDFDLSIRRTENGVEVQVESASQSVDIHLDEAQAAEFAWHAVRAAFPLHVQRPEDLQNVQPKAQVKPIALAWGAVGEGDLALTVFLHGLQPLALVLSDEQAKGLLDGLEQGLRIPRDLRITKSKN